MPSGPPLPVLAALVAAQTYAREYLGQQVVTIAQQAAMDYAAWYSADAAAEWSAQVAQNTEVILSVLAGVLDAYLATVAIELTNRWVRPTGTIDVAQLRRDITHADAFQRAVSTYRYQQALLDRAAADIATAQHPEVPQLQPPLHMAIQRATAVANRDVQLVVQQQSAKTMTDLADQTEIIGWRRMVHPELSKSGTCGLCIAASTRIYKTDELMPIHDHCHCLPMMVTRDSDPGLQLDEHGFAQLYGEAGGTTRELLKKTRYQVHQNGELGPVLTAAGAKQRGPRVVKADTKDRPSLSDGAKRQRLVAKRDSLQRSLVRLDGLARDDPVQWGDYRKTVADRILTLNQQLPAV